MILVICKQTVFERPLKGAKRKKRKKLFLKGNVYIIKEAVDGRWLSLDADGIPHIIADGRDQIDKDKWFQAHFREL